MVELDNLDPFMLRPVEKTALEPSRYKPLISSTKTNYLASFKIAYTVNVYPQAKNRMCCDEKQKLSAQERRDMQIISQPTWAIPTTRIRSFYFPNSAFSYFNLTPDFPIRYGALIQNVSA